jgi:phosphohistidine phosphatase SixA
VKIETLNPRSQRHRSRSVETKEYIFLGRVYAGVARLHFILMCRRAVANAKEIRMTLFSRRAAARLAATAGVVLALSAPCVAESLDRHDGMGRDTQQLVQRLRSGGYVIVVRHGATATNQADTDPFNFNDVTKQRNLNDKGMELAKAFGDAVRRVGLPVGEVYTSKFNRAYETAVLAGFKNIERTVDLTEGGLVVTPDENNRRAEAFRQMLARAPAQGKNNFLITHKPNIVDALGKDWFDVKEGEASIFRPEGSKYQLIARVQMEDWPKLAVSAN